MQSYEQAITGQVMMPDMFHKRSQDQFRRKACSTRLLVDDFYLCQANRKECDNAFPFGMNYLCSSLERHEFSDQFE